MLQNSLVRPEKCAIAIIDMLKFFAAEGNESYQHRFWQVANHIRTLKGIAKSRAVPIIYVNTSFESCETFERSPMAKKSEPHWIKGTEESEIIDILLPDNDDHIIEKTVNSGFFATPLDEILNDLAIEYLVITGVHTHVCVLLTAADAFYRGYNVIVPEECVTTIELERHHFGLFYINRHLGRTINISELEAIFLAK